MPSPEGYQPSESEINEAEKSLSDRQRAMSEGLEEGRKQGFAEGTNLSSTREAELEGSPEDEKAPMTVRAIFTVGRAVQKEAVGYIKDTAFMNGVELSLDEDKRLIESDFRMTLKGSRDKVKATYDKICQYMDQFSDSVEKVSK